MLSYTVDVIAIVLYVLLSICLCETDAVELQIIYIQSATLSSCQHQSMFTKMKPDRTVNTLAIKFNAR